jgi:poly(3-hydroxybutyrate) depolymerase
LLSPSAARTQRLRLVRSFAAAVLLLGLLVVVALQASAAPADATTPGCSLAPTSGVVRRTIGDRSYLLYVPPGLVGEQAEGVPLVLALHGLGSSAQQMALYTGFSPSRIVAAPDADGRGYVVAYPDSVAGAWDVRSGTADLAFVRRVIYELRDDRCIDVARVHVTGHSNGAILAQRIACDLADVVASVTAYATAPPSLGQSPCTPFRPIAAGFFHGEDDRVLDIALGAQSRDHWIARDGCSPTAIVVPSSDGARRRWAGCDDGVEVTWHQYPDQDHFWPGNFRRPQMVAEMWQLWSAHPYPVSECLPPAFVDVGGTHAFLDEVCWLVGEGITTGWADATFRPSAAVSRQSMAAFLFRLGGEAEPIGCTPQFPDVAADHPFFVEVCWMAQQGITEGYEDGTFRPGDPVRRQSMSAFLHRYEGEPAVALPATPTFSDVPADHPFATSVEWMATAGVSEGYPDGTFRPSAVVTRQAMAAFLQRVDALP